MIKSTKKAPPPCSEALGPLAVPTLTTEFIKCFFDNKACTCPTGIKPV